MIYLASQSPRRAYLLKKNHISFQLTPNLCLDETFSEHIPTVRGQAIDCAIRKAIASSPNINGWVLSADTIVVLNNTIFGKPDSFEQAFSMLSALSNHTHHVITAFCLMHSFKNTYFYRSHLSSIAFNKLSDGDISHYLSQTSFLDKAGSYNIIECPNHFIKKIDGDISSIMGLPIFLLKKILKKIHYL